MRRQIKTLGKRTDSKTDDSNKGKQKDEKSNGVLSASLEGFKTIRWEDLKQSKTQRKFGKHNLKVDPKTGVITAGLSGGVNKYFVRL